jgi:LuxR family maltose regulon positive regulatory protein
MTSQADTRGLYTRMKTQVPVPSPELIERPRLLDQLGNAAQAKLLLLHAPAGYGKTSLLQQWSGHLRARGLAVAWFTPERADRDANVFLAYLLHALEEAGQVLDDPLRAQATVPSGYSWRVIATQLANSFIATPRELYLVIDDLHSLRDCEALECLRYLIESTPPTLHFVLASREDPGIPLGRWRALGRVFELRAADLRFGADETASYFATRGHVRLTQQQLALLSHRTEGWIVGLKLLSMAMECSDAALSESAFTGEQTEIADFFAEDVLARQPAQIREFLLRTCVLERLCPGLCDSLPGIEGSRALLDRCDAGGLFLVALDNTRQWYRYHSLFADFLRRQLNDRYPGLADELQLAASDWLNQAGFHVEAFDYALRGNHPIRAAGILEAQCEAMWRKGQQQVIQSLAERLPPHVQALYPRIMLALAWRLVAQWRFDQAQHLVAVTRARLVETERSGADPLELRNLRHRVLHRESQIAHHLYQLEAVERLSTQLLEEQAGDDDPYFKASVLNTLQYAQREQFRLSGLNRLIEQGRDALELTGFPQGKVFWSAFCGPSLVMAGRLQEASSLLRAGLEVARDLTGHGSSLAAIVGLPLAELLYELNDIAGAAQLMEEYFRNDPVVGMVDSLVAGWITHSRLARLRGDFTAALQTLQDAGDFAERHAMHRLRQMAAAERVRLLLKMGLPDDAARYARRIALASSIERPGGRGAATAADSARALAWCRLAASRDKLGEALAVARRWRAHVTNAAAIATAVEWGVMVAELLSLGGDRRAAQRALWQALEQAARGGFRRTFLDEAELIRPLLEQMVAGERQPLNAADALARELCKLLEEPPSLPSRCAGPEPADGAMIVGALSTREREILALAGSGMLNKRISQKLGLTEGTVKWYLQQVFDKLGIRDRTRAATRARQLGLIH